MLDLGGFGPGLLTSSAYFLTTCWPTPSASSERQKLSGSAVLLGPER